MTMENKPLRLMQLLKDEDWLDRFSTYKQKRSILHQITEHTSLLPIKLIIETDTAQNFITIEYSTGEKITF
jgi:hypothetical protein